jgi:hypothetical protein
VGLGFLAVLIMDVHVQVLDFTMDNVVMELNITAELNRDLVVELTTAVTG